MSLTGQLSDGVLGRWYAATLTGTPRVAADVATAVAAARVDDPDHWATIGGALGQRLSFATQHGPPYYALLGAYRAGLTGQAAVHRAAARFPTHTRLDPARAARANQLRPLPAGRWLDLDHPDHDGQPDDHSAPATSSNRGGHDGHPTGEDDGVVGDLAARLAAYLARHAPPGRLAGSRGAEAVLARACVVLTDWETAYRGGLLAARTAARYTGPATTVDGLLAAVPDHQVAELVELVELAVLAVLAHRAGLLARLAPAPPTRTGIASQVVRVALGRGHA